MMARGLLGERRRVVSFAEPQGPGGVTRTVALACAVSLRSPAWPVAVAASCRGPATPRRGSTRTQTDLDAWAGSVAIVQQTVRPVCLMSRLPATYLVPPGSRSQTLTSCIGHGLGFETVGVNVAVPPAGIVRGPAVSSRRIRLCGPGV